MGTNPFAMPARHQSQAQTRPRLPWEENPYRLYSLADVMQAFPVPEVIVNSVAMITSSFDQVQAAIKNIPPDHTEARRCTRAIHDVAKGYNLWHTLQFLQVVGVMFEKPDNQLDAARVSENMHRVFDILVLDLHRPIFLFVPDTKTQYYTTKYPFGEAVSNKFQKANFDIHESSKCFALSRPTASVYHAMRVLELAIKAISLSLGIPSQVKPAKKNWHIALKAISDEVKVKKTANPAWTLASFYDNTLADLLIVKDAWRNESMHVGKWYADDHAAGILHAVHGLMERIAAQMDQSGKNDQGVLAGVI